MKKITLILILQMFLVMTAFAQNNTELKTVQNVDLKKYSGKWFEIGRYQNKFEQQCVGNVTANYTIKKDNKIEVLNECLEKDGEITRAKGKARIVDKKTNAKLEIRFAPAFLSFLPQVWGDYWIIDLDDNYQNVAIGDPKRAYFWILSRQPEMNDATYQAILRRVEMKGFDPAKVYKTAQNVEIIKGEVIQKQ